MISCPHCRNPIHDPEALLCHFCGNSLNRASRGALGKIRYKHTYALWITVALVLAAFLLLALS